MKFENCEEKISVIVPVFRVEKYLDDCVMSLTKQTYSNLEIILVDDGSDDFCPEMCDRWGACDERIVVLHKKNGGLSDARNAGLDVATGNYISYVDSDDVVDSHFIERLYDLMKNKDCDIAICGIKKFADGDKIPSDCEEYTLSEYRYVQPIQCFYKTNALYDAAWNKLYKRSVIGELRFPIGKLHEDVYTTYKVIMNSRKVGITQDKLYFYRQRGNSITGGNSNIPKIDIEQALWQRIAYFEKINHTVYAEAQNTYLRNTSIILKQWKKKKYSIDDNHVKKINERRRIVFRKFLCDTDIGFIYRLKTLFRTLIPK